MKLEEHILAVAELSGRPLSNMAAALLVSELEDYPPADVTAALDRCMREGVRHLSLAAVLDKLPGAHVRAEEAWSIASQAYDETATVVWTDEIAEAFGSVRHMKDRVAARMAFRETYERTLAGGSQKPQWWATFGSDAAQREAALAAGVACGRLPGGDKERLLPAATPKSLPSGVE